MGLLLSVFAVCVGVMELLAFYHNVGRQPAVHHLDGKIARGYMRDLNRERLRILSELGEEDNRPDLTEFVGRTSSTTKIRHQSKELHHNDILLQIRKASLEESPYKEDIVHHISLNLPQQSSLVISHATSREEIFGKREGSPYPTHDLLAPRHNLSSIDTCLLEVDESTDIDRRSNSPTPQKIDIILQESNFDTRNFWPNKNLVSQQKECLQNKSKGDVEADEKANLEEWFKIVDNNNVADEEDRVPEFDTSVLRRIDGVGAKPRTPSEERKLKLKKKRGSKSLNQTAAQSSAVDSDVDGNALGDSTSASATEEPFWLIFSGEYTKAMNKDWHGQHFCCWKCDESLTGQRYVLRDDHPYCVTCYETQFANGCEKCNKTIGIDSKDLSYKDKHWHEACFLCTNCGNSLVDKQFGSKSDRIYCGGCYDEKFASRCDGCGQIFRAGTKKMEYKTRQWHEQCFCCITCKVPIGTQSFIPRDSEIYCAKCYEEKYATRCIKCNKVITSGGVTYKNEPWHRECFTCTNCASSLAGARFTSRDDKPYCANCFGELFAKRCYACAKPITGIGGTKFISFEERHWHNDCFYCAHCHVSLVGRGFITDQNDIICPDCAKQKLM